MGHFYFVRHGETVWNTENKVCGITDSPLTKRGHQQAIETGKRMLAEKIKADEILHSPLSRATDTAGHIAQILGLPMRKEERLKEQNFGKWEGTPTDAKGFLEAKTRFADKYENGESMFQLAHRVYSLLDEIKKESQEKTYILVAHNGVARIVNSYFADMGNRDFAEFQIENCQVLKFEF